MTRAKLTALSIASVLCLALAAPAITFASAPAAANHAGGDGPSSYVAIQGDRCIDLQAIGDGTETVEEFYEYSPHADDGYSSQGTIEYQRSQVSQLFVYHGQKGVSLVFLHDKVDDGDRGGAITMQFDGLPTEGEWSVEDDNYTSRDGNPQDDNFDHGDTSSTIDWMWHESRMDGGAFRGLSELGNGTITIEAAFGENSYAYHERNWTEASHDVEWKIRYGDGNDDLKPLDKNESLSIERGACPPQANLTVEPETVAVNESVTLDASDSTSDDGISTYYWDLNGDGTVDETTQESTTTHTYRINDTIEPTVVVQDDPGVNSSTATTAVTVYDKTSPNASAVVSPENGTVGEPVEFNASASTDNGQIASYEWSFDDGAEPTTGEVVTNKYEKPGTYNATLNVTDAAGNTGETAVNVTVSEAEVERPAPTAVATADTTNVEVGETVSFDGSESTNATAFSWTLDDGTTGDGETVDHAYDSPGEYTATLTVTRENGETDTDDVTIDVDAKETPDPSPDPDPDPNPGGGGTTDPVDEDDDDDDEEDTDDEKQPANASADRVADGSVRVNVTNPTAGEAVSVAVPGNESTGLRAVELVPANDGDRLNVTLVPDRSAAAPNGTDVGLFELAPENGSDVRNVTYQFAVDGEAVGDPGDRLRVLAADGDGWTPLDYTVVENGSATVVNATADGGQRIAVAATAPDVSARSIGAVGEATAGESVAVEATLANGGHADANRTVELAVDGVVVDSTNVTVPANGTTNVSFETTFEAAGDRRVSVAGTERTISVASPTETADASDATDERVESTRSDDGATATPPNGSSNAGGDTELVVAGLGVLVIGAAALVRVL